MSKEAVSSNPASSNTASSHLVENKALSRVRPEEKQSTASITFIWIGGTICVPVLMVGALLISGLSLGMTMVITLIAFAAQVALMTLNGMEASDTGYPLSILMGKTFGESGSRFLTSTLLAVTQTGWFGIQTAVCGAAFSGLLGIMGVPFPVWLSSTIWGVVMMITAVCGFSWMKYLNYISVPLLVVVCLYGTITAVGQYGIQALLVYQPPQTMAFVDALAVMIGVFATGTLVVCDITRYAKSRKATLISSVLGIIPAILLMVAMGAVMSIVAGTADITLVFANMGLPVLGIIALILATWTTNTSNAYTAGLALTRLFALKDNKRAVVTAAAGIVGTLLAALGIAGQFELLMGLLSTLIPPIAGIMVADYWIIGKGDKSKWGIVPGFNWIGIIAWLSGALVGLFVPIFSKAFNSIIVGMLVYLILMALVGNKLPKAEQPEE